MPLKPNESRVTRRGPDGQIYQWSNAQEVPDGSGWLQASKASFPRVRTYLWFRPFSAILADKRLADRKAEISNNRSPIERMGSMMFRPFHYIKQKYDAYVASKGIPAYQANERVSFAGQTFYTVGGVNSMDQTIQIRNPITGETKQVNAKELSIAAESNKQYTVGDKVILAKGSIDSKKEHEALIVGYDKVKGTFKVSISALDPKQRDLKDAVNVYPEAIDAFVPNGTPNNPAIQLTDDALSDPAEKQVIETLNRAFKSGRNTVQLKEIINDLRAHGNQVGEHQVVYALDNLNRLDPNIQYNTGSGGVYIGAGKSTLEQLMKARKITPATGSFGLVNLTQDNQTDTYAHEGISVKNDQISGSIDSVIGDIATVLTGDRKYVTAKLSDLKDEYNRSLHVDNAAPRFVGNVRNKDIFWVLRDREGVKSIKEGDTVSLLPGISDLKLNKGMQVSGKVLSVNKDGTVDMLAQVGTKTTRIRAFNRQLAKTPQLKSMQEFRDYLHFHAKQMPGKTLKVNDTVAEFGSGKNRSINLTFLNGEDYANNEHLWFAPIKSQNNPNGWESVINSLGNIWSKPGDYSTTLAPSKALLGYINEVYPNSKFVTIARDTTTTPEQIGGVKGKIQFKVTIDRPMPIGKRYNLDRLYENYGTRSETTPIAATALGESNTIRMETDGEDNLFISVGKMFKEHRSEHLPAIELFDTELAAMSAKQRDKYEANKGKPTLYDVINSSMFNRRRAWDALPGGREMADNSGVFTYDEPNDRFMVDLDHYDEAHKFLKDFFGEDMYNSYVFETEDKGYYAYAKNKILDKYATAHKAQRMTSEAAMKDTAPLDIKGFYQGPKGFVLRNYQNAAARFGLRHNAALLAMDQGTGKTATSIAVVVEKLNRLNKSDPTRKHRAIIIAPAAVAQTSWMKDLKLGLTPTTARGDVLPGKHNFTLLMGKDRLEGYKRLADDKDNTSVAVTSFNTFALQDWQELKDIGFDVAVIDEAQAISGEDITGVITERIGDMLSDVTHKLGLTGTPLENKPEDLQAILGWLNPSTFGDSAQFMRDFVDIDYVADKDAAGKNVKRKIGVRLKNLKALRNKLSQIMFRIEKEDLVSVYNDNTEHGTHAIDFGRDRAKFDKYTAKYLSNETDDTAKARLGEIAVIPGKTIYPQYEFVRDPATKAMRINSTGPYGPITTEGFPEYQALLDRAKIKMREEFMAEMAQGKKPSTQAYLIRMQQVLNDPSLLAKKYGEEFAEPVKNPKLERLYQHIDKHFSKGFKNTPEGGKIIIFAEHVETLKMLEQRLTKQYPQLAGRFLKYIGQGHAEMKDQNGLKTRMDVEKAFNNDPKFEYPIMLANNAAKTGVNLPAANMVINYDIGWNPQDINQRIDRAHRVRSIKDLATHKTAPARNVFAHSIVVTGADGDINSTVETRKLFVHKVKSKIFDVFIKGKSETDNRDTVSIPDDNDSQKITEELLNVSHQEGNPGVDPERAREYSRKRSDEQTRQRLRQQYGLWARYVRGYPRESK